MEILKHFEIVKKKDLIVYRLKEKEMKDFIDKLTEEFRLCYISDKELKEISSKNKISLSECLEKYILPDDGKIKSGDFGEMLSFFVVIENFDSKGVRLVGPRKWRWKDRNKPSQYVDSILFHRENLEKFSTKDSLITIESKMKATKSKKHRIQEAIDGAVLDKLTRLAKTLNWLEEKYARLGKLKARKLVERFKDPATYGTFEKKHKAIVILDINFELDETTKKFINDEGIIIIVFSFKDLKLMYEETRTNLINSV